VTTPYRQDATLAGKARRAATRPDKERTMTQPAINAAPDTIARTRTGRPRSVPSWARMFVSGLVLWSACRVRKLGRGCELRVRIDTRFRYRGAAPTTEGLLHLGQGRRRRVAKWSPLPIQRAVIPT
jgi:hypothetical protein